MADSRDDPSTFSNFKAVAVKHWLWKVCVDFDRKKLKCSVQVQAVVLEESVKEFVSAWYDHDGRVELNKLCPASNEFNDATRMYVSLFSL